MIERPDMWKKLSALSQASASDGTMGIKLQRTYHRNDEDETEVENDNVAKGVCGVTSLSVCVSLPVCLSLTKLPRLQNSFIIGKSWLCH